MRYIFATFLFSSILLAFIENGLILLFYLRYKERIRRHLFEITQSILGVSFALANIYYGLHMWFGTLMQGIGCELYAYLSGFLALMSVYQPALMAVEWCTVVVRPFIANRIHTKHRLFGIFLSAVVCNFLTLPPLFGFGAAYRVSEYSQFCCFDFTDRSLQNQLYLLCLFAFGFALPVSVFVLTACLMCIELRPKQKHGIGNPQRSRQNSDNQSQLKRRQHQQYLIAIKMSTLIGVQLVCWTPFAFVTFVTNFTDFTYPSRFINEAGIFAKLFCVFSPIALYWRDMRPFMMQQRMRRRQAVELVPSMSMRQTSSMKKSDSTIRRIVILDDELEEEDAFFDCQ